MKKLISNFISFSLGIILFSALIWFIGVDKIVLAFKSFSLTNLVFILVLGLAVPIPAALVWDKILKLNGIYMKLSDVININFAGDAISYLTPSAFFGGEPIKCWAVNRRYGTSFAIVLSTVIIEKFLRISAAFFAAMIGMLFVFTEYYLPSTIEILLAIAISISILIYLFFFTTIFNGKGFLTALLNFFKLNRFKAINKRSAKILDFDKLISDFFTKNRKESLRQFALSSTAVGISLLRFYVIMRSFGIHPSFFEVLIIFSISVFSTIIPLSPGALGSFEAFVVFAFAMLGYNPEIGLVTAFMIRVSDIARIGYGVLSFVKYRIIFANKNY